MKKTLLTTPIMMLLLTGCYVATGEYEATRYSYANLNSASVHEFYQQDPVYIIVNVPPPVTRVEYVPAATATTVIWIPGCWDWSGVTYQWVDGYYTSQRSGYFWRVPRYIGGRYYRGRWVRGTAPRWHYSHRVRPGTYYRYPATTSRHYGSRGYHGARSYRHRDVRRAPIAPRVRRSPARRTVIPPWSPDYKSSTTPRSSRVITPPWSPRYTEPTRRSRPLTRYQAPPARSRGTIGTPRRTLQPRPQRGPARPFRTTPASRPSRSRAI